MIELGDALRAMDDAAWDLIEKAMTYEASLIDVGAAAAAVHVAGRFRRKYDAGSKAHDRIDAEYLACLSARLQEIDEGSDLAGAMAAAASISGKPFSISPEH